MLSFCILDDLHHKYGPIHIKLNDINDLQEIKSAIRNMISVFKWKDVKDCIPDDGLYGKYCNNDTHDHGTNDPSSYFDADFFKEEDRYINIIAASLLNDKFFAKNRYNKYYVIAFAINYAKFDVYSKDCTKKLINWLVSKEGETAANGIIQNKDYNENPVVTCMRSLGID